MNYGIMEKWKIGLMGKKNVTGTINLYGVIKEIGQYREIS
jgi:hypothetical protein